MQTETVRFAASNVARRRTYEADAIVCGDVTYMTVNDVTEDVFTVWSGIVRPTIEEQESFFLKEVERGGVWT